GQRPQRRAPGRAGARDLCPGALGPSGPGSGPDSGGGVGARLRGGGLAEGAEVLELALEVGGVLEVLVDAGEAHVGDRVELAEGVEELDADLPALPLALAPGAHP